MVVPAPAVLSIDRLRRRSTGAAGLEALSQSFLPGKVTAILGDAACGKSSLVRLLAGLDRPSGGRIELDGIDVTRFAPRRRMFGVARREDRLFSHLTIAQNLMLPLRLRGIGRRQRAPILDAMLDLAGLDGEAGLRPAKAGAAMVQRAILARAFVGEPRVALLDEPFVNSSEGLEEVGLLRRLQAVLGTTVILATQHGKLALALAERVIVLRAGRVEQEGRPEDVFTRPRDAYAAGLFGEMNRLPGTVEALEEESVSVRLACGPLVEAMRGGVGLEAGKPCIVLLRPEAIAVAAARASELGDDALDARIVDLEFYGDAYCLRLLIGSGEEILVRRPSLGGLRNLAPGRGAAIAWQMHQAFAYRV